MKKNSKIVEFISYDGKFPCLCYGKLILKINGQVQTFPEGCLHSNRMHNGCLLADHKSLKEISYDGKCSGKLILKINGQVPGGRVHFDDDWREHVNTGKWSWSIDFPEELEDKFEPLRKEIEECINEHIPHGCCGGC